ncbi:SETMR methyltransferase, partial [Pseudoatta argentina]
MSIQSPAKCEIRSVIRYLVWKGKTPVEVYNEVKTAYGDKGMNRTSVFKWCREFKNGRTSVHDDQRSGRPSILTDDIVEKIENALRDDRRLTVDELSAMFPQISRSLLHETITETLGYRKLSARWVPKQLTDQHKLNRVEAGQEFLRRYKLHGDEFLRSIVTGDETWVEKSFQPTRRSSRESYGDQAIDYVCLKRKESLGTCTELECYWRRSSLASVDTTKKYIELKELGKINVVDVHLPDNSSFLKAVVDKAKEKQLDSQLSKHNFILESEIYKSLLIHQLLLNFCEKGGFFVDDFLEYASKEMLKDLIFSDTLIWYSIRYDRVTASRLYEAAHCKTFNGTFVQQIIGASQIFESQAMQRGKKLEKEVLIEIGKITRLLFKDCGLVLLPSFPVLGALPNAIGDDIIVEVKCPSSTKTFDNFLPNGKINEKKCIHVQGDYVEK